nr:immunoglobulin heavy chain junction region [Mus musculus]MBK4189186.1 immunoglobulin heavy chain junction region [Mus musculus]MBK4189187.1 immunoglobulin heavy chain junction region [Mus musculus]
CARHENYYGSSDYAMDYW